MAHAHTLGSHATLTWHRPTGTASHLVEKVSHTSPAAAVLVALPAFYGALLIGPVQGLAYNPVEFAGLGALFYIAGVALAAVDEHILWVAGVKRPATAYWALLTVLPYLNARTSALAKESHSGLATQWAAIATLLGTVLALGALYFS